MTSQLDLIVIGTGTGALGCATRCRKAGWEVAIVDALPYGGTCALRGCDPKKMLVGATESLDWVRRMSGRGVLATEHRIEWPALIRFKRSFMDPVPEKREGALAKGGIRTLHGAARFIGPTAVQVGEETLKARFVHIAVGARPADLGIPGAEHVMTSTDFLELPALPRRLALIGGGYISFEFAHIAVRAGAEVTVLHRGPRPLQGFDPDLVDILLGHTRQLGVDVRLNAAVCEVRRERDGLVVHAETPEGRQTVAVDALVHGAGRIPAIAGLGLELADISAGPRGVLVNDYMQSVSNPSVYAAGDCADTPGPPLTPVAGLEGRIAARNMLEGNVEHVSYPPIPSLVFTVPPLAKVGLHEADAREKGYEFEPRFERTEGWFSTRRVAERVSAYKLLVEKGSRRILGAHLLGPGAEEQINLFAMAMNAGLTGDDIQRIVFGYPTFASDIGYMV